jgi:hypothetical protein
MAKTQYILISQPNSELYYSGLQSGDRFSLSKIRVKKTLFSRNNVKGLTQKSLLPRISDFWNSLTLTQQEAWTNAGSVCGLTGFRLFVQDTCARIKNGLSGLSTPSLLHQSLVGELKIASPATELKIEQLHPESYYVYRKVTGSKTMYEPVKVTEDFALPLTISLSYKSDLVSVGAHPSAVYFAEVWSSYQGRDILTNLEIPLTLSQNWVNASAVLTNVLGYVVGYTLYFWLRDVTGYVYIDNVKAIHSGQNWVRDTNCQNISQEFTKAFQQIPSHWSPVVLPNGSEYHSVFPID